MMNSELFRIKNKHSITCSSFSKKNATTTRYFLRLKSCCKITIGIYKSKFLFFLVQIVNNGYLQCLVGKGLRLRS